MEMEEWFQTKFLRKHQEPVALWSGAGGSPQEDCVGAAQGGADVTQRWGCFFLHFMTSPQFFWGNKHIRVTNDTQFCQIKDKVHQSPLAMFNVSLVQN